VRSVSIVAGAAIGFATQMLFNIFRYGTVRNLNYLDPQLRTPGLGRKFEYFVGLWVSPNAGIVWFWPIATALLVACLVIGVHALRRERPPRRALAALAVVVVMAAFTAGLANWYTPFGWIAYGPRLAAQLLPAGAVAALYVTGDRLRAGAHRLARVPVAFGAVVLLVALAGWPQYGAPWSHSSSVDDLIAAGPTCPRMTEIIIQDDRERYFDCASRAIWRIRPAVLDDAATAGSVAADTARVVGVIAVALACVELARSEAAREVIVPHRASAGINANSAFE
jgi:hypothetical protein